MIKKPKDLKQIFKIEEPAKSRFPQSKELFVFVRNVIMDALEVSNPEKLSDIQIGKLVGYGYEVTSRWKHGRIKFDSAEKIMLLHEHLGISEYLLLRVATGKMDSEQAFKIWKLNNNLKNKFSNVKLADFLNSKKIDYDLVILQNKEGTENLME